MTETHYDELSNIIDEVIGLTQDKDLINCDLYYFRGFTEFLINKELPKDFECTAGFTSLAIDYEQNVRCCWMMKPVGNLKETNLLDLWNSDKYKEYRAAMIKLECPKCWLRCQADRHSEGGMKSFMNWIIKQQEMTMENKL